MRSGDTGPALSTTSAVFQAMPGVPSEGLPLLLLLVSPRLGSHDHRPGLAARSGHLQEQRGGVVLSQPGSLQALSWWSPFQSQPLQPGSNCLLTPLKDPGAPARDAQGLGERGIFWAFRKLSIFMEKQSGKTDC